MSPYASAAAVTSAFGAASVLAVNAVDGETPIISTVLSLGGSAAAVFVVVMFLRFIQDWMKTWREYQASQDTRQREQQSAQETRQNEMYNRLFEEMRSLAQEKGAILSKTADSMRENTEVTRHLEKSIDGLGVIIRELGMRAKDTGVKAAEVARDAKQTAEMLQKVVQASPPEQRLGEIRGESV